MASKVNTRFVVTLGAALVVAFGVVGYVAYESIKKSGDDYVALGDKAMAGGKYQEAAGFYSRAVFKDQRNPAWITKWIGSMEKQTPAGRAAYQELYQGQYVRALRALAEADHAVYEPSRRWLDENWEMVKTGPRAQVLESYLSTAEDTIKAFKGDEGSRKKLTRYRGLARITLVGFNPDYKAEDLDSAQADLSAALEADPADHEAMIGLCQVELARAEQARKRDDKEEMKRHSDAAMARVTTFIKEHPPAAAARTQELSMILQAARQSATGRVSDVDILQDRQDRQPKIEELVRAVVEEKPERLDLGTVRSAWSVARLVLPHPRGKEAAAEVLGAAMKAKPDNPTVYLMAAEFDLGDNQTDAALAHLQQVVDMPDRPLSLPGLLLFSSRDAAVRAETDVAFRLWEQAKDPAARAEKAALAKKFRDEYVARRGEADNNVLAMDGRLALINGDIKGATTLLTRYTQQASPTDERVPYAASMALLGTLMMRQDNTGAAKQAFERVLQLDPRSVQAMASLATIAETSQDFTEALRYSQMALQLRPEDPALKEQEEVYRQLASGNIQQPVVRYLIEAQRLATGVDASQDKAIAKLREGLAAENGKHAGDVRLHIRLIQMLTKKDDKPALLEAVEAALAKFTEGPMSEQLKKLRDTLVTADPVKTGVEGVNASNASDLNKHIAKYQIYFQAGKLEDAAKEIAEIRRIAPEDAQAVDLLFEDALRRKDKEELKRLAEVAERKNLDQVNGQLYRARVLFTEEKYTEAAQELNGVLERDKLNFNAWRLLGVVQGVLNNVDAAVAAFGKALEIRPTDLTTINGMLRGLMVSGRTTEALALANKSEKSAAANPEFVEMFVALLSVVPGTDNKERALRMRRSIAESNPGNIRNTAELAVLQMRQRKWAEAKASIDTLRADPALRNDVTELDARWNALQGNYGEVEKVYDALIESTPKDKLTELPYQSAAALLLEVGQFDRAIAFLEKARPLQSRETMSVDRKLGDIYFQAHKPAEAVASYKRVLEAGSKDEGDSVAKRLLECYVIQKDWAKFDEMLASMGDRGRKDATLMVLAADAAGTQGDDARAASLYDRAVAADQKNFMSFIKRAEFSRRDKGKVRDALADYEQAIRLAPQLTMPRQRLASLYLDTGKTEEAIAQLNKALEIDPGDDAMRRDLIELDTRANKDEEVVGLVEQAVKLKPDDTVWLLEGGRLMQQLGKSDRASEYLARAWANEKTIRVAIPYVTALLEKKREEDLLTAATVATAPELKTAEEMPLHLLKAMVLNKSKRPADAEGEVAAAIAKVDHDNGGQVELFMAGMDSVYNDQKAETALLQRLEPKASYKGWMLVHVLAQRMREPSMLVKAAADLEKTTAAATDPALKVAGYSLLGSYHLSGKHWPEAIENYKKGLEITPDDIGMLNNCAYILAERLQQYSDALPYARRAGELAPTNAVVQDTLGAVQLGLRNCVDAERALQAAVQNVQSDNTKVEAMLHLARAESCLKKKDEAQRLLGEVRKLFEAKPKLEEEFIDALKKAREEIDGQ